MGLRLSTAARNAGVSAILDLFDAHATLPGKIRIYTGVQPATPDTAVGGATLLVEFTLADPAFGAASAGSKPIDADPVITALGVAAGDAGWFRGLSGGDAAVMDGTVSATGGGGQLEINTVTVSVGLELRITGGTVTMPLGA